MSQTPEGFYFNNIEELLPFFRFVRMFNPTEKERIAFMRKLVARKKAKYIPDPKAFMENRNAKRLGF